jgi:glycine oxidase
MLVSQKSWDVIMVGGGIIGISIAWRLAQKNVKVLVVDRQEPGREASFASAGMLAPYTEAEEDTPLLRLAIASREIYPDFLREIESETGRSAHYRDDGALFLAHGDHEAQLLSSRYDWQRRMGFAVERLTGNAIQSADPALSPEIKMALFYPGDHQLDNRALVDALLAGIRKKGVEVRASRPVQKLLKQGNVITGVEAGGEKLVAKMTVLTAGAWSPLIENSTGEVLPVYPTRGQIIAVRAPRPVLKHTLRYEGGYVAVFPDSRLLLGGTMEDVGYSKANTAEAMHRMFTRAIGFVPSLGSCEFVEAWSGLRPNTKDHLPILGRSSCDGLVYATGHFRNGMLLAPITAKVMSELILEGRSPIDLEPFRVGRFHD